MSNGSNSTSINDSIPVEADYFMRVLSLTIHILYFIIVFLLKELRTQALFQMHHTNIIGLLTAIHYTIWISSTKPLFEDENLNNFFCSFSEAYWALTKFARAYSILAVATYRIFAVFKLNIYKRLIKSYKYTLLSTLLVWLLPSFIFIGTKFPTTTLPGLIYCYDGYSTNTTDSIIYYCLTSIIGFVFPFIGVIIFYSIIRIKLHGLTTKLKEPAIRSHNHNENNIGVLQIKEFSSVHTEGGSGASKSNSNRKEKSLAHQFIVINLIEIGSILAFMLLSLCNIFPILNGNLYFLRQLLRMFTLLCQSSIPIISLAYHPNIIVNLRKKLFKIFCIKN